MKKIIDYIKKNKVKIVILLASVFFIGLIITSVLDQISAKVEKDETVVTVSFDNPLAQYSVSGEDTNILVSSGVSSLLDFDDNIVLDNISENSVSDDEIDSGEEIAEGDNSDEYANLAIADVTNYVNVRSLPSEEGEIVGYIYKGAVANVECIAGENQDWFKINSGNVNGYIKAEYFIAGDAAADVAQDYVTKYATVACDRLNVRQEADVSSSRIGYIENGEKVKVLENQGDWLVVEYTEGKKGFVSAEFVVQSEEFTYARTLEEDKAIKEAAAALLARETDNNENNSKKENLTKYIDTSVTPADSFGSNAELRQAIVNYACQFVGGPYVSGGNSLTNGTDCSGFTMFVYQHFGYNLSRIPQGQLDGQGRKISYDEIQPGDLVFYSSKGVKATHAALYIGNGQVVHATNHRDGIKITSITWVGPVWGLKNVID